MFLSGAENIQHCVHCSDRGGKHFETQTIPLQSHRGDIFNPLQPHFKIKALHSPPSPPIKAFKQSRLICWRSSDSFLSCNFLETSSFLRPECERVSVYKSGDDEEAGFVGREWREESLRARSHNKLTSKQHFQLWASRTETAQTANSVCLLNTIIPVFYLNVKCYI